MEKEKQKTERKEHILVCLSFSPSNEKIIRTAAQMARAFGANFTALYVQTAEPAEKTPEDQARLQKHIRLAEQSGAEIVTTHSEDIALQIAEYARISEVTRIVIGKSMMDQGFFRKRRGWTERLTDLVPDLEIHIIPDSNIITIYLVGVMMTSILTSGYTCSVISSVISVVLFNYFLTEPRLTLYAYGSGYPVTFAIMLGISILTGTLASKLKENAKLSARDAFRTKILFNTSQLLQKAEDASEIFDITATKLVKLLGRDLTAAPAGAQESRIVRGTLYSAQTGGKTEKIFDRSGQEEELHFINEEHHRFYSSTLKRFLNPAAPEKALCYCLGIHPAIRWHVDHIYDFSTKQVTPECIHEGWVASAEDPEDIRTVIRMAYNLYGGTPSVAEADDQLRECQKYTANELFGCRYAPYFWEAIKLRYPEYTK